MFQVLLDPVLPGDDNCQIPGHFSQLFFVQSVFPGLRALDDLAVFRVAFVIFAPLPAFLLALFVVSGRIVVPSRLRAIRNPDHRLPVAIVENSVSVFVHLAGSFTNRDPGDQLVPAAQLLTSRAALRFDQFVVLSGSFAQAGQQILEGCRVVQQALEGLLRRAAVLNADVSIDVEGTDEVFHVRPLLSRSGF